MSLAGAAKVEVEEDKARLARKMDELVESFMSKKASYRWQHKNTEKQNFNPQGKIAFKGKDGKPSCRDAPWLYSNN